MFQCQWLWWRWWQLFVLPLVSLSTAKIGDRIVYRMASHFHTRGSQGAQWRPLTLSLFTNHTTYIEPHNLNNHFKIEILRRRVQFELCLLRHCLVPIIIFSRVSNDGSSNLSPQVTNPLSQPVTCPYRVLVVIEFQSTCCHNWAINNLLPYLGNILIRRTMRPIRGLDDYVTYFCNCFSVEMM